MSSSENFEEISIPVPWGNIKGKWWGSRSNQPIIAVHGWQSNAGTFDTLAPLLTNEFSLLCIDLPGHGYSSHYPAGQYYYIFWDGILILRRIVKHYDWKKIKILGHSLGGAIAFMYAACYPDEVESFASIDIASPSFRETPKIVSMIRDHVDEFLKYETLSDDDMPCYDYKSMFELVFEDYADSMNRKSCEVMMKREILPKGDKFIFSRDPRLKETVLGFLTLEQSIEFASRITCKVLNIRAEPGMDIDNPEYYGLVLDKISETAIYIERHNIPGTHQIHLNDPQSIVDIIKTFFLL